MGVTNEDKQLLDRYRRSGEESAFAEIVRRYVNLVYSAACRRVGDGHVAEDVTQAVFMILARKPQAAGASATLSAWLLTTVRYASANALKLQRRQRRHEAAAAAAHGAGACSANPSDALVWQEIAAELDDAVLKLSDADRAVVLLRYFEHKPISDVARTLNTSEAAAGMRLTRAVEKLRKRLTRRGIAAPAGAAGLATLIGAHATCAAPAGLLGALSATSVAGAAATASGASYLIAKGAITMMTWTKIKAAAVVAVVSVLGAGAVVTINGARAQDSKAVAALPSRGAVLQEKADARVRAAERVVELLELRAQADEPLTPSFVELRAVSQKRLAEARIDATQDPAARVRAAEQYVKQCGEALELLKRRQGQDVTPVGVGQGAYQLADAEYMLAKLQPQP